MTALDRHIPVTAPSIPNDISQEFSVWLDVLRLSAALVVVLGHAGNIRFTDGDLFWVRQWTLAPDAVIVFFVISGFVVGRAAARDGSLGVYAFNRATRLFSVMLPALILTLVFDAIGNAIDPGAYLSQHYEHLPVGEFLLRGLSFSQEWRGFGGPVQLGSNAPLWSLSFEAAYYILLGVVMFMRGLVRLVLLIALIWVFGLPILALLPTWLAGLFVWHLVQRGLCPRNRTVAMLLAVVPIVALVAAKLMGAHDALLDLTSDWLRPRGASAVLGFAREVLWNIVIAICLGIHLIGMSQVAPRLPTLRPHIRWWAGASFSIYVMHYPIMHLMDAGLPEILPAKALIFVALPVAFCLLFAQLFERTLPTWRRLAGSFKRP